VSRGTQDTLRPTWLFAYRGVTFYAGPFQTSSTKPPSAFTRVLQPRPPKGPVWAPPRSLAAT